MVFRRSAAAEVNEPFVSSSSSSNKDADKKASFTKKTRIHSAVVMLFLLRGKLIPTHNCRVRAQQFAGLYTLSFPVMG